jgi:hypothetical protein
MISGINPYTISSIRMKKFLRIGPHPSWTKVMCKRNPIRGVLGFYSSNMFDGYYPPQVFIYGSDGHVVKQITCRSTDHAKELCNQLNAELAKWVQSPRKNKYETI